MNFSYNRNEIGDGIFLTEIKDKKFKSELVKITFVTRCRKETVCANALLQTLLITSNKEIKSRTELSRKLAGLYGASISAGYSSVGDYQTCSVSASFMSDRFTINSENISEEVVRQLLLCVFEPDITDGKFNESYFNVRKQELCDNIAALINEKRSYAIYQARSVIFENEPSGVNSEGSMEYAEKVSQEDLLAAYGRLLKSARIEIMVSGDGETRGAVEMIKKAFSEIDRENTEKIDYINYSPLKDQVREVCEEITAAQSKMVMGFKSPCKEIYTAKLFCAMLGGSPFSKLFSNVREKLSLCYYCAAGYNEKKGTMIVDSGVETENIEKTKEAILQQLEEMKQGNFTDEELENTKLYMTGSYKSVYDSVYDVTGWFETQNARSTEYTPEQLGKIIGSITREQIIDCAKSFSPDTVYVMKAKGVDNDE